MRKYLLLIIVFILIVAALGFTTQKVTLQGPAENTDKLIKYVRIGYLWSDGRQSAIKGGRYDESIVANDTTTKDYWMIDNSIEQIMWLESRDSKISNQIKSELNLRKIWIESEKKKLLHLSVDSLINIIRNALDYVRKDTLGISTDQDVRWHSIEAVAILLGEKGDKSAIPVLEELCTEQIWIIGDNNPAGAQIAASGALAILELSPAYHEMNKEEKVRTLLQVIAKEVPENIYIEQYSIYRILAYFAWETDLLPVWIEALSDSSRLVREVIAKIMVLNPQVKASDALLARATMKGESESIRRIIIYALGRLKSEEPVVIPTLRDIVNDPTEPSRVRAVARYFLNETDK